MENNLNKILTLVLTTILVGCGSPKNKKASINNHYKSPFGKFSCEFSGNKNISDSFGPHGGTVKISDFDNYMRIDVEEFEPKINISDKYLLQLLYYGYFESNTIPLIKQGVADASEYYRKMISVNDKHILFAVVEMPNSSINYSGKDSLRGMFIYSNGEHIYVYSMIFDYELNKKSKQDYINIVRSKLTENFEFCAFPS